MVSRQQGVIKNLHHRGSPCVLLCPISRHCRYFRTLSLFVQKSFIWKRFVL